MAEVDIKSMLPDELEELKKIIDELIVSLGLEKETNQKYQQQSKITICPKCSGTDIVKNGHKNKTQKFKCKSCNSFFSITTNTITSNSRITYDKLIKIIDGLVNLKNINKISEETSMSQREIYNLRIKIISTMKMFQKDIMLKDIIQVDEKYIRLSFKGTRTEKMPRKSKESGSSDKTIGISNEQVCVVIAIDSNDKFLIKVAGLGPASTNMIENSIGNNILSGSILVTDSKSSYKKFANNHDLKLIQIKPHKYTNGKYNLAELNSLMSEIEIFIQHFRGISTRHLQEYLDWFRYLKVLKYTVKYLEHRKSLYTFSIISHSSIKNKDVCKRQFPVDISKIYDCDFK